MFTSDSIETIPLDQLKKMVDGWHRLIVLCVFWVLVVAATLMLFPGEYAQAEGSLAILVVVPALAIFLAVAVYGTLRRTPWGRPVGVTAAVVSLAAFPLGTLFGLVGLWGYADTARLFGPAACAPAALKAEIRRRGGLPATLAAPAEH